MKVKSSLSLAPDVHHSPSSFFEGLIDRIFKLSVRSTKDAGFTLPNKVKLTCLSSLNLKGLEGGEVVRMLFKWPISKDLITAAPMCLIFKIVGLRL